LNQTPSINTSGNGRHLSIRAVAESLGCLLAWSKPREWQAFQPLEFLAELVPLRAWQVQEEVQNLVSCLP